MVSNILSTGQRIDPPSAPPKEALTDSVSEEFGRLCREPQTAPTPEEMIDTIRKLMVKRDKLDDAIVGLKEQLIVMVKKL